MKINEFSSKKELQLAVLAGLVTYKQPNGIIGLPHDGIKKTVFRVDGKGWQAVCVAENDMVVKVS